MTLPLSELSLLPLLAIFSLGIDFRRVLGTEFGDEECFEGMRGLGDSSLFFSLRKRDLVEADASSFEAGDLKNAVGVTSRVLLALQPSLPESSNAPRFGRRLRSINGGRGALPM